MTHKQQEAQTELSDGSQEELGMAYTAEAGNCYQHKLSAYFTTQQLTTAQLYQKAVFPYQCMGL